MRHPPEQHIRPCISPRHKHWPAGPVHFSDRRTSSGQYILSFTGPYGPPRYMSGHQISNSAGPNDDKSQHIFFARAPVPHIGSTFATARSQRGASRSRACQSNTLTSAILQCEHPGRIRALFSAKHMVWFRVNSVSFGWWFIEMRGDFWSVNLKY